MYCNARYSVLRCRDETEEEFAACVESYAGDSSGVLDEPLLINYFLRRLLPTTAAIVAATVQRLPIHERLNLSRVRRIAKAKGKTYRARAQVSAPLPKGRKAVQAVPRPSSISSISTIVGDQPATPIQLLAIETAPEPVKLTPVSGGDSSHATALENVEASGCQRYEDDVDATTDITKRIEDTIPLRIPDLLDDKVRQASSTIPADLTNMCCWFCRTLGHSMSMCPCLSLGQQRCCACQTYLARQEASPPP